MNRWVVSTFWLSWIMLLRTWLYEHLSGSLWCFWIYPEVELLDNMGTLFFCIYFLFGSAHNMQKFPGQRSNPRRSGKPSRYSDDVGFLTRYATRELQECSFKFFFWGLLASILNWVNQYKNTSTFPSSSTCHRPFSGPFRQDRYI